MDTKEDILKALRSQPWREELRKSVPAKERTATERLHMPEVDAEERSRCHMEVNLGLSEEQARQEAKRCLDCVTPTCISGCPVEINIPKFVKEIEAGNYLEAARTLKDSSALPAVCGRVCPQEIQCEASCFLKLKLNKEPVGIGNLERFAADFERKSGQKITVVKEPANGIQVAVVGGGPAGITAAGELVKYGYDVTVFEALHEIGGVLKYGIPEFRLPNEIVDFELNALQEMGVKFETNFIVGRTHTFKGLSEMGFKAFFVASGAGLPNFMGIPGENLIGVLSSNEYLTRVNLMGGSLKDRDTPLLSGKKVAVIGGGNTAMDAVRTARRLGAEEAMIIYRRSIEEMPARVEEIKHAQEEGVIFKNLHNPVEYIANDKGRVCQMRLQKMELGEPDASGRRRPVPMDGSEFLMDVDIVIVAVGVSPNPLIQAVLPEMEFSKWGTIVVNKDNNQSSIPDIFAGGDIIRGGATVILAMGDGKKAALGIHEYLQGKQANR